MKADIYAEFTYNIKKQEAIIQDTNIKKELIQDFLLDALRSQTGRGHDHSEPNKKNIYQVLVECNLYGDLFSIYSNIGNKGLETGLILAATNNWKLSKSLLEEIAKRDENFPRFA